MPSGNWRQGAKAPGVRTVNVSGNTKLGPIAATYVSQASCPKSCPFFGKGCYAENPPLVWAATRHLNRSRVRTPERLAYHEARLIDKLPADRDLRLHVVGDTTTAGAARRLAAAAARYIARGAAAGYPGIRVWSYTHAWRNVPRKAWGAIAILASCETPADVRAARARGYATALVVPKYPGKAAYRHGGVTVVPCPSQTAGVTCADCRLCTRDEHLRKRKLTIGFEAHGTRRNTVSAEVRRLSLAVV